MLHLSFKIGQDVVDRTNRYLFGKGPSQHEPLSSFTGDEVGVIFEGELHVFTGSLTHARLLSKF